MTSDNPRFGLKEDWASIQKILEEIIPVYDKTNRYISLGTDVKLRKRGIDLLVQSIGKESFSILDMGCGTGKMSLQLIARVPSRKNSILLLDPIRQMARVAKHRTGLDGVIAVFECLPFRKESFEAAMAGFAIRDAKNLSKALEEICMFLKEGGKFLIVDLSKPDSKLKTAVIGLYWRAIAPIVAFFASGRLGLKFGALARTFYRLPKHSEFFQLIESSGFRLTTAEYSMLGGACVLLLSKET